MAITGNGTIFKYNSVAIGDIISISAPSVTVATIDTTSVASIYRTFLGGTIDSGTMSLEIMYDPNSTAGAALEAEWEATASNAPVERDCEIEFSDSSKYAFKGILVGMSASVAIDDRVTASVEIKLSGAITVTGS
tara:strand:- start:39 stop:443 length:405 start_codon:yes stop_codon:yes gene_type:complete